MKLFKLDLLTLLISLFILGSCKTSDQIGINPANDINGILVEEAVKTATVAEDPVITNSLSKFPIGYFQDPIFGKTTANVAMSLNTPSTDLTFGTAPALDSAVLVLKYADGYYGDATAKLQFEVYQLAARLQPGKVFYNTDVQAFDNSILVGSRLAKVNTVDSVLVTEIVKGAPDVQKKKAPQIRITLDPTFINSNFLNADVANFKTNSAFNNFIKGLYVTVNGAQTTGAGGIAYFDLSSADGSKLELYYKNTSGTTVDTTVVSFPIQNSLSPVAAEFKHDYTGTLVETQLNNPNTEYDDTYVQAMAGVKTRVNFPNLDQLGKITVNKAELIVSVDQGTADVFKPVPRLFLYQSDIAGQKQLVPDISDHDSRALTDAGFGGFYDSTKKRYTFVLTSYVQDLLSGKLKQYNTYISAVDSLANRLTALPSSGTTAARVVIGSGKSTSNYKMKLNIIYTKAN